MKTECLEGDLDVIISNWHQIDRHDLKARLEPSREEMKAAVKSLHPKWNEKQKETVAKIAFRDFTKEYVTSQKIAGTLSKYGDTKAEIRKNMREHLINCEKCRLKYAKYLGEQAEKMLGLAQKDGSVDEKIEGCVQRVYINFLKAADIFGFSKKQ